MASGSVNWVTEESVRELLHKANIPAPVISEKFIKFAEFIAKEERERCAAICDAQKLEPECPERAEYCAEAIRNQ